MKIEKLFLPLFIVAVLSASVGIYLFINSQMEKQLTANKWCVEREPNSGTSDCKLLLSFENEDKLVLTLEDGQVAEGKWSFNGEVLSLSELGTANRFAGDYVVEFSSSENPILMMNSDNVGLVALGIPNE
jgi:hypothetical protein